MEETDYNLMVVPEKIEDLKEQAMITLQKALGSTDKLGAPSKVAVDAAKFIYNSSSVKDSDEYRKMISDFKNIIIGHRKKDTKNLAEVDAKRKTGVVLPEEKEKE